MHSEALQVATASPQQENTGRIFMADYDVIVIGSGCGGITSGLTAAHMIDHYE